MYAQNMEPLQVHDLHVVIVSLPSALGEALNRGSILTKYVCTYVRGGSHSGMSHGMSLHTIDIGRPYAGICASHSLTHSDTLDSDIDRRRCSGAIAPWIQRTPNTTPPAAIATRTTRASLHPAAYITRARVVCALARGKDAHAYS